MESFKQTAEKEISRGRQWLSLLGLSEFENIETSKVRDDGSTILFGDFDEICGHEVEGIFAALESGQLSDEDYNATIAVLRESALGYTTAQVELG